MYFEVVKRLIGIKEILFAMFNEKKKKINISCLAPNIKTLASYIYLYNIIYYNIVININIVIILDGSAKYFPIFEVKQKKC